MHAIPSHLDKILPSVMALEKSIIEGFGILSINTISIYTYPQWSSRTHHKLETMLRQQVRKEELIFGKETSAELRYHSTTLANAGRWWHTISLGAHHQDIDSAFISQKNGT